MRVRFTHPWSNEMVTSSKKDFAEFPERVRSRTEEPNAVYELQTDREDEVSGPIYALQPGGSSAIPTGLVFVRFKSGVRSTERLREIEDAGYEISETVEYAAEAVWVRAKSGDIADALKGIDELEKIADVENVEPQMLRRRSSK